MVCFFLLNILPIQDVAAVLSHGIIKKDCVPAIEIDRAIKHRKNFEMDPKAHTYEEK